MTGLANLTFAYTIPDGGTCSKVQAVLSGLQTGSVMVTGRGARDGCPQFTVSPGGVLTCSIEPLPTGPLTVWLNSTGAGNVTIHFWAVPAS